MHRYELVNTGAARGRTVHGWDVAMRAARLDAAHQQQPVEIWTIGTAASPRTRRLTVFPDGSRTRDLVFHRLPARA